MCNPRGKKNLMMKGRILFTMQPSEAPRLAIIAELMTEMGKLLQKVQNDVRSLQRRRMPQAPIDAEKGEGFEKPKGPNPKHRSSKEE